jgi:hypothetical protein
VLRGYDGTKSTTNICAKQVIFQLEQSASNGRARSDRNASGRHSVRSIGLKHNCDHGNGNDEVTPSAELQKSRCCTFQGSRDEHGDHDFARLQRCLAIADDELGQRKTAGASERLELDLSVKCEERRYSISRG